MAQWSVITMARWWIGGKPSWFVCPARNCGRRVAILYRGVGLRRPVAVSREFFKSRRTRHASQAALGLAAVDFIAKMSSHHFSASESQSHNLTYRSAQKHDARLRRLLNSGVRRRNTLRTVPRILLPRRVSSRGNRPVAVEYLRHYVPFAAIVESLLAIRAKHQIAELTRCLDARSLCHPHRIRIAVRRSARFLV
jgi:hypothetical protein